MSTQGRWPPPRAALGLWVCSLPWRLRILCGYDWKLCAEVLEAFMRTALRVQNILARHGRMLDGTGERDAQDVQPEGQLAVSACYGAAASGLGLDGDRAGQPLLRIVEPSLARQAEPFAEVMGFNVHAQVVIPARGQIRDAPAHGSILRRLLLALRASCRPLLRRTAPRRTEKRAASPTRVQAPGPLSLRICRFPFLTRSWIPMIMSAR